MIHGFGWLDCRWSVLLKFTILIESNFLREFARQIYYHFYLITTITILCFSSVINSTLEGGNKIRKKKKSLSAYLISFKLIKIIFTQVVDFSQLYLNLLLLRVLFVLVLSLTQSHPQRFNYNFGVH